MAIVIPFILKSGSKMVFVPRLPKAVLDWLTVYVLFAIGVKGGGPILVHSLADGEAFLGTSVLLILWGLIQPWGAFYWLRRSTSLDSATAAAVAAAFGSVSIMTFVTALSFLDALGERYMPWLIATLALMELPAIVAGLWIAQRANAVSQLTVSALLKEALGNKAVIAILVGLGVGMALEVTQLSSVYRILLVPFSVALGVFLFDTGMRVGVSKNFFQSFPRGLGWFGIYMPMINGLIGVAMGCGFGMSVGGTTLIAVLMASASYIAVPAAMRAALPQANAAIYMPLALGIAFPFNVLVGIPLFYYLAKTYTSSV
ncbi:MAG: hypothetical protein RL235_977 [Chlamydiota bacterium]